jgi:acetyl-CoA carboxylase biotin carboxyl carrier protein
VSINITEIRELLLAIAQTDLTEVNLKTESFELTVRKNGALPIPTTTTVATAPQTTLDVPSAPVSVAPTSPPSSSTPPETASPSPEQKKWVAITAPMVGTFYRAPSPDEAAYVNVNDTIRSGQVVCIVEAMKLMNEIEAEVSGKIMEIAVENGEPVEYGQTLMWVNPE